MTPHPVPRAAPDPALPVPVATVARRPLAALLASLLVIAALVPSARAQTRDVDAVLAALEARAAEVVDLSFVLEGQLIDEGG
jgi:hypothetical protein